jgi:hypothetical protein
MAIFSKASNVNDSVFGKSQEPIKLMVEQQEEAQEKFSVIPHLFMKDETTNFAEKYTYETSLQDFQPVGENGAYPKSTFQEGYSKVIEPDTWKNSFEVTLEMIEDAKMGKVKQRTLGFMIAYNRVREKFGTALWNSGQNKTINFGGKTFDISAADAKALFATDHPSKTGKGSAQSNLFNNIFSYDALSYAEEAMQYFRDDDGELLNLQPDTIVIPNKARIKKLVFDAIGAEGIPENANNSASYQYDRWNIVFSSFLDNTGASTGDSWGLMDSKFNETQGGLVWLERVPLSIRSTVDDNTDANVWRGRCRYGAAPNNWRPFLKSVPGGSGTDLLA